MPGTARGDLLPGPPDPCSGTPGPHTCKSPDPQSAGMERSPTDARSCRARMDRQSAFDEDA